MAKDTPLSLFDIAGKSVLVIGATGTLGGAAALALGQCGCLLTIADRNQAALDEIAIALSGMDVDVATLPVWPDSEKNAAAIVEAAVAVHGRLDMLFIALGLNDVGLIEDQSLNQWRGVIKGNLDCYWLACKAAGMQFARQPAGPDRYKVAVVSSTRGRHGLDSGYTAYCASKAGLEGMVRALAGEWGRKGININAIAPTLFRSPVTEWMFTDEEPGRSVREDMLARIPVGRLSETDDLIGGLIYLLSPASDFVTGQTLYIDGGYTAV